jgi:glycerophosphoryl diester phosphodiesterase
VVAQVEHHGMDDGRVLFSSFNHVALRRAKKIAPHIPGGLLQAPDLPLPLRQLWLAPFVPHEARHPEHTMVNATYVTQAHWRGLLVNTWTVDEPDEMIRLIDLGVDCIITNRPDVLHSVIEASA